MLTLPVSSRLLRTAEAVLLEEHYQVRHVDVDGEVGQFLLAENEFFILGLVATSSLHDLLVVHPLASKRLLELIDASQLGAKRWDVYLVLLTEERVPLDSPAYRSLKEINYDTMGLRRIARAGVGSGADDIQTALRSFLPLPRSRQSEVLVDALRQLELELPSQGVREEDASRAIAHFRSVRTLADA